MDERGLKVYEYNADSASCHTEAGLILERWAEQGYKGNGFNPAEGLINELAGALETQSCTSVCPYHAGQRYRGKLSRAVYGAGAAPERALKRVSCAGWMNWAGMLPGN